MGKRAKLRRRVETLTNENIILSNQLEASEDLFNTLHQDHEVLLDRLASKTNGLYTKIQNNLTPNSPDQTSGIRASSAPRVPVKISKRNKLKRRAESLTEKKVTLSKQLEDSQDRYDPLQANHIASLGFEHLIDKAVAFGIPKNMAYAYLRRTDNDVDAAVNLYHDPYDYLDTGNVPMEWKPRLLQHTSDDRHKALDLWLDIREHIVHLNAMNRGDDEVWSMLLEADFDFDRVLKTLGDEMQTSEHRRQPSEETDESEFMMDSDDDGYLPEID
ncbi:uncharacterized protein N0V89_011264 [Didymosphaeria variabile]|uniref:UBA domain-containing protein n=1 Tax=Didymosphaeria variabile TaxID=1932322 RepID=A0A9W8XDB0_9PLEO|nr:uncharacterized protein N0V89_011264 [Didymosphaeria variabile]KAJ4347323.1 hypothetical protein N0V89_011264 [Didymosphaeria variabile]